MILLDTNVISELRLGKRQADTNVVAWAAAQPFETLFLSAISLLELRLGMEQKSRVDPEQGRRLQAWIEGLEQAFDGQVLAVSGRTARLCAPLHVPNPMEFGDSLIAATALEHGLILATRNVRDFEGRGMSIVNPWQPAT